MPWLLGNLSQVTAPQPLWVTDTAHHVSHMPQLNLAVFPAPSSHFERPAMGKGLGLGWGLAHTVEGSRDLSGVCSLSP